MVSPYQTVNVMNCIRLALGLLSCLGSFVASGRVTAQTPAGTQSKKVVLENPFDRPGDTKPPQPKTVFKKPKQFDFKPVDVNDSDDELLKLLRERFNAAVGEVQTRLEEFRVGRSPIGFVSAAAARMLRSEKEIEQDAERRSVFFAEYVELTKMIEEFAEVSLRSGTGTLQEVYLARHQRLDGQIQQLKHKRALQAK